MVKNVKPSLDDESNLNYSIIFNNELYFICDDGINGKDLWKTDATTTSTFLMAPIKTLKKAFYKLNYLKKENINRKRVSKKIQAHSKYIALTALLI